MVQKMNQQERIEIMKTNLGNKFAEESKITLRDGKVLKGEDAEENFNTKLNTLTFELETLYPLTYQEFKNEFPKTIELVNTVEGSNVVTGVEKGFVIQGWSVRTNVDEIINNIKENISDENKAKKEIELREEVFSEIQRMKEEFDIEWNQDLFWKAWKIKEGEKRFKELVDMQGETLATKRIQTLKDIGGLEFLELLQKEVYGE